eukprot:4030-Heterococcus_DN1.PRE.1
MSARVVLSVYRTLLGYAREFNKHRALKAVIPFPLPVPYMVLLGGKNRDFFGADKSCSAAVKEGFRANAALDPQHSRTRTVLNLVIQLQAQTGEWLHSLSGAIAALDALAAKPPPLTYADLYQPALCAPAVQTALGTSVAFCTSNLVVMSAQLISSH